MELVDMLKVAVQAGASDIHLVVGKPPLMRVSGEIIEIPNFTKINAEESKRLIYSILYEEQRAKFEETWELDCSFAVTGLSRFRVNVLLQKNGVEAVMRVITTKIPTAEQLRLPKSVTDLADLPPWDARIAWLHRVVGYLAAKRALAEELFAYVDRDAEVFRGCRTAFYAAGEPLLQRAQEARVVRADTNFNDVIQMVGGIAKIPSEPEHIEHILAMALDGLRYRAPGS